MPTSVNICDEVICSIYNDPDLRVITTMVHDGRDLKGKSLVISDQFMSYIVSSKLGEFQSEIPIDSDQLPMLRNGAPLPPPFSPLQASILHHEDQDSLRHSQKHTQRDSYRIH